jgi:uncharacterized membrane protein
MSNPLHNELKKEFQLERLILFSDAVFAIAITLLVIEIKVPEIPNEGPVTEKDLIHEIAHLIPKFFGFIISFMLIGLYWSVHHRMFGFVTNYTRKLIVLNLFYLFTIVLMPFSTGIFGEYSTPRGIYLITPIAVYVFNICLTGIANFLLWKYIGNPRNNVAAPFPDEHFIRNAKVRSLIVPTVFLLMLIASFWNALAARYVPMLIPVITRFVQRKPKPIANK